MRLAVRNRARQRRPRAVVPPPSRRRPRPRWRSTPVLPHAAPARATSLRAAPHRRGYRRGDWRGAPTSRPSIPTRAPRDAAAAPALVLDCRQQPRTLDHQRAHATSSTSLRTKRTRSPGISRAGGVRATSKRTSECPADDLPSAWTLTRINTGLGAGQADRPGCDARARNGQSRHLNRRINRTKVGKPREKAEHEYSVGHRTVPSDHLVRQSSRTASATAARSGPSAPP